MKQKFSSWRITPNALTALKCAVVLVIGAASAFFSSMAASQYSKEWLLDRARTASQLVSVAELDTLEGSETDLKKDSYKTVKQKMMTLREINHDTRFAYLLAKRGNDVVFLADSEPEVSDDYSPPGQVFDEVSPNVAAMFTNKHEVAEGPTRDRWGVWLSALTPIIDSKTGEVVAVFGFDVPAQDYLTILSILGGLPVMVAVLAALIIWIVDRSRKRQYDTLVLKSELISIISHELSSPLTGIRWAAESLMNTIKDASQQNTLRSMHASVRHLQESIDDVLEIARLSRDGMSLNLAEAAIDEIMNEVFSTQKLAAEKKQVTLAYDVSWPADLQIVCDASRIRRVFNNIISNAVKYTLNGTQVVVGYEHADGTHRIWVRDQGIGIPREEKKDVLKGFYRASNAVNSGEHGTGMGLFLSRNALRQHGGDLSLVSEENAGTTAFIELPDTLKSKPKKRFGL